MDFEVTRQQQGGPFQSNASPEAALLGLLQVPVQVLVVVVPLQSLLKQRAMTERELESPEISLAAQHFQVMVEIEIWMRNQMWTVMVYEHLLYVVVIE